MTVIDRLIMEERGLNQGPFFFENHEVVQKLRLYKKLYLPEPKANWIIEEFQKRSYEIWGIDHLIWQTLTNSDEPFLKIFGDFYVSIEEALNMEGCCTDIFQTVLDTLSEVRFWLTWEY